MTRKEAERQTRQLDTLRSLGFTRDEAESLRRISMTLRRWFELECGDSNEYGSWAIERDDNGDGPPYMVRHSHYVESLPSRDDGSPCEDHGLWIADGSRMRSRVTRTRIADRETGARKRLAAIVAARNKRQRVADAIGDVLGPAASSVTTYIQTDPRGAALYILRPGDVPEGGDPSAYYTRGICVY